MLAGRGMPSSSAGPRPPASRTRSLLTPSYGSCRRRAAPSPPRPSRRSARRRRARRSGRAPRRRRAVGPVHLQQVDRSVAACRSRRRRTPVAVEPRVGRRRAHAAERRARGGDARRAAEAGDLGRGRAARAAPVALAARRAPPRERPARQPSAELGVGYISAQSRKLMPCPSTARSSCACASASSSATRTSSCRGTSVTRRPGCRLPRRAADRHGRARQQADDVRRRLRILRQQRVAGGEGAVRSQ